jgi:hypothetical protein
MHGEDDPAAPASRFPDPVVSANLYCAGRLDEVIRTVVVPFRRELLDASDDDSGEYLWMMRYGRGGEHLKIRLHATEPRGAMARNLLEELAGRCFSTLGANGEPARAASGSPPAPIDHEDEAEDGHPDRSVLWTQYRRSLASFAGKPLLADDTYAALATRCMGRGCDLALAALDEELSPIHRLLSLLQALVGGIGGIGSLPADSRAAFFAFHRDGLVRSLLVRRNAGPDKAAELLAQFERRQQAMGSFPDSLRNLAEKEWNGADGEDAWRSSLADLYRYVAQFRGDPEYRLDPFAEDAVFPVLFKVFHGLANQLGIGLLDEAFAHHLLLAAARPPGMASLPVCLYDLAEEEPQRAPSQPARTPAQGGGHQWSHFVIRSGPEGKRWMEEYENEERLRLTDMTQRALQLLRRQQIAEGKELLDHVESRLDRLDGVPASVLLVMKRFFWAALAYYHYCVDDAALAEQNLERADQAVVSAVEAAPFLLPLALHAHEFRLQHARVARYRRRWSEMRERLQEVRAMLEDRIPLSVLSDGTPVYFSTIVTFLNAIPSLDAEEIESLRFFLDGTYRRDCIDLIFMSLYVQPGVVIHYP